jgi:uncharacterized protein
MKKGFTGIAALLLIGVVWLEGRSLVISSIHLYQRQLAPIALRLGATCRFEPSCSRYAETVIARDGVVVGGWKTMRRLVKCGPWTPRGTRDDP